MLPIVHDASPPVRNAYAKALTPLSPTPHQYARTQFDSMYTNYDKYAT